ncbi:MAG: NlpC/P60 family protein [Limnochordia bacterium]|jgi:hypothetical protein
MQLRRCGIVGAAIIVAMVLGGCTMFRPTPIQRPVSEEEAAAALDAAMAKLGSPYVWGERGPDEFDSSGIIVWAYRQVIPELRFLASHRRVFTDTDHANLYERNLEILPLEQLRPGDIVYLTDGSAPVTHGAMFVRWIQPYEVMEFLDASTRLGEIVIQEWPVQGVVRGQWFVAGGRLKIVI